jgi:signal transduction histidine kinase
MGVFRRKRTRSPDLPELEAVDHSLATAAIDHAVEAHQAAQAQATEARQVVDELRRVNLRNGFAPAIEKSVLQRFQGRPV